jgi:hypothetical protein
MSRTKQLFTFSSHMLSEVFLARLRSRDFPAEVSPFEHLDRDHL